MADNEIIVEFKARDKLSGELKQLESGVIRFVGAVSSALTALTLVSFPIREAARFQEELLNTARTTGYTRAEINELQSDLSDLSTQIGVSAADLAKIATLGGQVGIGSGGDVKALVSFTQQIAAASVALGVGVEEASESFGKLITIFDIAPEKFGAALSTLVEVGNASNATSSELFDVARRIGNLGGSIDFPQAVALSGALIDLGQTAETAGTTLTKIFSDMKSQAQDFANFISSDKGAISASDFASLVASDGLAALNLYLNRLNEVSATEAAVQKIQLTGGGRIFEAVTKLQLQLRKSNDLRARAAKLEQDLESATANGAEGSKEQVAATQARIAALRDAAEQANIVNRLEIKARKGFDEATASQDAQALVLSGLNRQFDVFLQQVNKVAIASGNTALPSLTNMFRALGASIGDPETVEQVAQGVGDVVQAVNGLVGILSAFSNFVSGSGTIDLDNLIRLGSIIAAAAAFKGFTAILNAAGRSIVSLVNPTSTLGKSLGLAAVEATRSEREVAKANVGFSALGTTLGGVANSIAAYNRGQRTLNQIAAGQPSLARQAVNGVYSLETAREALRVSTDKLAAAEDRLAAAVGKRQIAAAQRSVAYHKADSSAKEQALSDLEAAANPILDGFRGTVDVIQTGIAKIKSGYASVRALLTAGILPQQGAAAANTAVSSLSASFAGLALRILGVQDAWIMTEGRMARGAVLLAGAVNRVAQGFGLLFRVISRFVGFVFFATLAKEVLDMLGLLEPLLSLVEKLFSFFGKTPPTFLRTDAKTKEITEAETEALRKQNLEIDRRNALSAKFNDNASTTVTLFAEQEEAAKRVKYNIEAPLEAQKEFNEAVTSGAAAISFVASQSRVLEQRLRELGKVNDRLSKDFNDNRQFSLLNKKISLEGEIADLRKNIQKAEDGRKAIENVLTSGLTVEQVRSLVGDYALGVTGILQELSKTNSDLEDAVSRREKLVEASRAASGQGVFTLDEAGKIDERFENIEALNAEMTLTNGRIKELSATAASLGNQIDKVVGTQVSDSIKTLGKLQRSDLDPFAKALSDLARTSASAFKGSLLPPVDAQSLAGSTSLLLINQQLVTVYRNLKVQAEQAAIAAETSAKQAVIEVKNIVAEVGAALSDIQAQRRKAVQEGRREVADRLAGPELRKQITDIEQRAADEALAIRERYNLRIQAFGVAEGVAEKLRIQGLEQQRDKELQRLQEQTDARIAERQRAFDSQSKKRVVDDAFINLQQEEANVKELKRIIDEANRTIADQSKGIDERTRAVRTQEEAMKGLKQAIDNVEAAQNEIKTLRVEDTLVLSDQAAADFTARLGAMKIELGNAMTDNSNALRGFYQTQGSFYESALASATKTSEDAIQSLRNYAQQAYAGFADPLAVALQEASKYLVQTGQYDAIKAKIEELKRAAVSDPSSLIKYGEVAKDVQAALKAASDSATEAQRPFARLTETQTGQIKELETLLTKLTKSQEGAAKGGPVIEPTVSQAALDDIRKKATSALDGLEITVDKVNLPKGAGGISLAGIAENARGGLVRGYATGGKVTGPGSGTSDSILSWLSSGEFVMDALTTSRFGSGFFELLQKVARGGNAGAWAARLRNGLGMPSFALGGSIGRVNPSDFATDFKMTGDVTYLDLTFNGKRTGRVAGEANAINGLVKALKDIERGTA